MRRLIESLDDPRQVIDPIRKPTFSIKGILSSIVDGARNAGDELRGEAGDLKAPERSIERGGQEFSGSGRAGAMETDRLKSRIDTSLPIKETRDTDDVMLTLPEGKGSNEDLQRRAIDPDITKEKPPFDDLLNRAGSGRDRIERDAREHPREEGR